MWERKTAKAMWNGHVLNIQSTTLDGGKRLQIDEMPYRDDPEIKVMGAKARTVIIEAQFVGVNSLFDANALVNELDTNPVGNLAHPYLGELSLVFSTSSLKISTKKGLVVLSLNFIKQGVPIVLTRVTEATSREQASVVREESKAQFVKDVAQATPEQVESMQFDFTSALNVLRNIANLSTLPSAMLSDLHRKIGEALTAVGMIVNAPATLLGNFNAVVDSLVNVISDDKDANTVSRMSPPSEVASKELSHSINPNAVNPHCNIQLTLALVLLSGELPLLTQSERLDVETFINCSLSKTTRNIELIQGQLNDRLNDVSCVATFESLALVESIEALLDNVIKQSNKLKQYQQTLRDITVLSARPLLCIAQSNECEGYEIERLNNLSHPLFVVGKLQVSHV